MSSTAYKHYQFKENGGSREFSLHGFNIKETQFMIGTYNRNSAFLADPLYTPFQEGKDFSETELFAWAQENKFDVFVSGIDGQKPYILTVGVNAGKTVVTITFNQLIDKVGLAAALKAAITFASDGTTFSALGGSDTVGTVDGTASTLVITFNSALTTATNKIKIAADALKDATGNQNAELITAPIDVKSPLVTFLPADSATGVSRTGNITLTYDEKVFKGTNGAELVDADLAAMLTLKETDGSGADVAFTATINAAKTIITINPTPTLAATQAYYVAIAVDSVRDLAGNKNAAANATFTTGS